MDSVEEKKPKNNDEKPKFVARTPTDIQRIKLEKLMKNPVCKTLSSQWWNFSEKKKFRKYFDI